MCVYYYYDLINISKDFFSIASTVAFWWNSARIMPLDVFARKKRGNKTREQTCTSARASDRKLSISKSIWPGLPIGCRLISRWIVSNMGILLMARREIGCTSNRRGLQPRSRALPKSIARGWRYALALGIPGLNALWCCCNGGDGDCTAVYMRIPRIRLSIVNFEDDNVKYFARARKLEWNLFLC